MVLALFRVKLVDVGSPKSKPTSIFLINMNENIKTSNTRKKKKLCQNVNKYLSILACSLISE